MGQIQEIDELACAAVSGDVIDAAHDIATVGQHQFAYLAPIHGLNDGLAESTDVLVAVLVGKGIITAHGLQGHTLLAETGKQLGWSIFAYVADHRLASSISKNAPRRVSVCPSLWLRISAPSPSSNRTGIPFSSNACLTKAEAPRVILHPQ